MEFKVGDKAVYSSYGVGIIKCIESGVVAGSTMDFYVIQIQSSGATVKVPTSGCERAGMRNLITDEEIKKVFKILRSPPKISQTTWNRRFREFNDKLRTGSVSDVAEVLRDLCSLKSDKELSFSEKNMLEKALKMIVAEISAASARPEDAVKDELNQLLLPN